jgi:hypothetical protein
LKASLIAVLGWEEISMIDHIGFPVSDYERSKAFYAKALAPLDYSLVMEVA